MSAPSRRGACAGRTVWLLAIALLAAVLLVWALVAGPRGSAGEPARALLAAAQVAPDPSPGAERQLDSTVSSPRAAAPATATAALSASECFLRGSVRDDRGRAIDPSALRVELSGPSRQSLALALADDGSWAPLRLVPGRWVLSARAAGHRGVERTLDLRAADEPVSVDLVLQRVSPLQVRLLPAGDRPGEVLAESMLGLFTLLALSYVPEPAGPALAVPLSLDSGRPGIGVHFAARLERDADSAGRLELRLGAELVEVRSVGGDVGLLDWTLDPVELTEGLVDVRFALYASAGEELEPVSLATLDWPGGVTLTAGQPDAETHRVRFPVCPPGPAHLRVLYGEGRSAEGPVFVPFDGPLDVEVRLETRPPQEPP